MTYKQYKGTSYEIYILNIMKKDYDHIFTFKDTPEVFLKNTKLYKNYDIYNKYKNCDIGADLVAIKNNEVYFIQCKNHSNTLCINDLTGFYFLLYEYELNGIVVYSNTISSRINDLSNKVKYIHIPFNNSLLDINYCNNETINNILIPRDYQIEIYNNLKNENKSIISLPSGMGKTFSSYLIAKEYDNIIIISPLRFLAKQLLEQIYNFSKNDNIDYNPILISLDGERDINNIIIKNKNIISSTYKSVDVLYEILKKINNTIIIIDEYHNLTENNLNNKDDILYNIITNNNNKILYLSATPNIEHNHFDKLKIYRYSWLDAINNKYINDFKIILPHINSQMKKFTFDNKCNYNINIINKTHFLLRGLLYEGNKKCIVYLTSINEAYIYNDVIRWMKKIFNIKIKTNILTCETSKTNRIEIINNFKKSDIISIILNVHILDEGIDIPECDSVYITKPNNNIINIVQRMCRCNRIYNNKLTSNIYIWSNKNKILPILDYLMNKTNNELINKIYKLKINDNNTVDVNNKKLIIVNDDNICINENINISFDYNKYFNNNTEMKDIFNLLYEIQEVDNKTIIKQRNHNDFIINTNNIIDWLKTRKDIIKETLTNTYKINEDYIITKNDNTGLRGNPSENILLTPKCFKNFIMCSKSKKSTQIREYYHIYDNILCDMVNYYNK